MRRFAGPGPRALFLAAVASLLAPRPAAADSAFVLKSSGTIVLARNLSAPVGDGAVFVNKRGVVKEALGGEGAPPLRWTSRFGSLTFNQFGREFPAGGLNEAGLAIEALPGPAGRPAPDSRPALSELQWVQYQLDNQRSVKDVLKSGARIRLTKLVQGRHFLVADRGGGAAVIEFTDSGMAAATGGDLPVRLLGDDPYRECVEFLNLHDGFGGDRPAPGGPAAKERFVRAAILLQDFLWPVPGILSDHAFGVLRSIEEPDTRWSIVYNLSRGFVFFKTRAHRRLKMIRLEAFDLSCGAPVLMLSMDTGQGRLMNADFEPYDAERNRALIEAAVRALPGSGEASGLSAAEISRRLAEYPGTCRCSAR